MSNKIVQLENESGDNLYPIAGGALTGSISKTMLEEGVFEGPELSEPSSVAYVATDNIQDNAVTSDKIDCTTIDLHDYKTALITSQGARAIMTIKGGIGMITTAGDTTSGSGTVYDNIPVKVPFTQELTVTTNSANQTVRSVIENGTTPGTSKISVASGLTFPAQLYLKGPFITE